MSNKVNAEQIRIIIRDAITDFRRARCYDHKQTLRYAATKYVESRYPDKHSKRKDDKIAEVVQRFELIGVIEELDNEIAELIVDKVNERFREISGDIYNLFTI